MVGNVAFRSAAIGGFNRSDVMSYIEKSVRENTEALEEAHAEAAAAQEKADELDRLNAELKNQLESQQVTVKAQMYTLQTEIQKIVAERDNLKDKVEQMEVMDQKMQEMEQQIQSLLRTSDQQRETIQRTQTANEEKTRKIADLENQVERMQNDSNAYHVLCDNVGQIMLDARSRTTQMEQSAQQAYDEKLAEAQAAYDTILANATGDAEEARLRVETQLRQLRGEVNTLVSGVNEAVTRALSDVGEVQALIQGLNGYMNQYAGEEPAEAEESAAPQEPLTFPEAANE
ncbi:MAG: Atg14 domain-containing protein [Clostridiales bacterium]|nr:Atg14 domain-containing protein [Clostridiales bacterium]